MDPYFLKRLLETPFLRDFNGAGIAELAQAVGLQKRTGVLECLGQGGQVVMLYFVDGALQSEPSALHKATGFSQITVAWMPEKVRKLRVRSNKPVEAVAEVPQKREAPDPVQVAEEEVTQLVKQLGDFENEDWIAVFHQQEMVAATNDRIALTGLSALAGIVSEVNGIYPTLLDRDAISEFMVQYGEARYGLMVVQQNWYCFYRLSPVHDKVGGGFIGRLAATLELLELPTAGGDLYKAGGEEASERGEYIVMRPDMYRNLSQHLMDSAHTVSVNPVRSWFRYKSMPVGVVDPGGGLTQENGSPIEQFVRLISALLPFSDNTPDFFSLKSHNLRVTGFLFSDRSFWAIQTRASQRIDQPSANLLRSAANEIFSLSEDAVATTDSGPEICALVVDDDTHMVKLFQLLLSARRYRVLTAESTEEALPLFEKETIDLAFLDLHLPGLDGIEMTRKIRSNVRGGRCRIAIVTGDTDPEKLQELVAAGADDFLSKPLDREQLAIRLAFMENQVLRQRAQFASASNRQEQAKPAPAKVQPKAPVIQAESDAHTLLFYINEQNEILGIIGNTTNLLGVPTLRVQGQPFLNLLQRQMVPKFEKVVSKGRESRKGKHFNPETLEKENIKLRFRHAKGEFATADIKFVWLLTQDKEPSGLIVLVHPENKGSARIPLLFKN